MSEKLTFTKKKNLLMILILIIGLTIFSLWQLKMHKKNLELIKENEWLISKFKSENQRKNKIITKKEGDYISDFIVKTIDNQYVDSEKFNYPALLLFFNTDCKSCLKSTLEIYRNLKAYQKRGLIILGLAAENKEILNRIREKNDIKFPIVQDLNSKFHKMLGIRGEPSFALISKDKRIVSLADFLNYREKSKNLPETIERLLNNGSHNKIITQKNSKK